MLIGWNRGPFFLITRALLVNQKGLIIDPDWLRARQQWVGFPLKLAKNEFWKFKAKSNASEFWMQSFHQLWKKIGMQK